MLKKYDISEIIFDGIKYIIISKKLYCNILFHLLIPLILSVPLLLINFKINNDIVSNIIGSISIFSGLLFSVIFIMINNYNNIKKILSGDTNNKDYLKRLKDFTNQLTTLILLFIIIGGCIICVLLLNLVLINSDWKDNTLHYYILLPVIIILLFNYLLTICKLLNEIYKMIYHDINQNFT